MLFDLKGKRRRVVQVTYLGLAILIGLGLIGFGVGSGVNGGLSDIFGGGGGSNTATKTIQKRIDATNRQLALNPHNPAALSLLVRDHYQLASTRGNATTTGFTAKGRQELAHAADAWKRYLAETPKPDPALAAYMFQAFDVTALNQPENATKALEVLAAAQPTPTAWVKVVVYASLARDSRAVASASQKALRLAPPSQRATVKQQIKTAKAEGAAAAARTGTGPAQP